MKFIDLHQGSRAKIVQAQPDCQECVRLMEMGLVPGTVIEVKKVAPFGSPVEIEVRGYRLCIRKEEMHCFDLEEISS